MAGVGRVKGGGVGAGEGGGGGGGCGVCRHGKKLSQQDFYNKNRHQASRAPTRGNGQTLGERSFQVNSN